jgi:hypothetical protein
MDCILLLLLSAALAPGPALTGQLLEEDDKFALLDPKVVPAAPQQPWTYNCQEEYI